MNQHTAHASDPKGTRANGAVCFCLLAALLTGCAHNPFLSADCARIYSPRYNILVCADAAVMRHCLNKGLRFGGRWDNGTLMTKDDPPPPACYSWGKGGRKGNILIGESYIEALGHEICHAESEDALRATGWNAEAVAAANAKCEKDYPPRWRNRPRGGAR